MYQPYFHVGILVRDIEAAAEDFTKLLGLEFEPTRSAPTVTGQTMQFRYSLQQGGPYLELVQMTENDGIWGPNVGEGLHHIAFGHSDIPGRCVAFDNQTDTVVAAEDGSPKVIFTRAEALHGVRVEYLESAMVAATLARLQA